MERELFSMQKMPGEIMADMMEKVRKRRKEQGLTQKGLSQKADVSLGSIKRFESTGEIALKSLIKIAIALGCEEDFDSLFSRKKYTNLEDLIRDQKN